MMKKDRFWIPESNLKWIEKLPKDRPVGMLIRHSVRPSPLPMGPEGFKVGLTQRGHALARELGSIIKGRVRRAYSSPSPRCIQTAQGIITGAGQNLEVIEDHKLGDPGTFVIDDHMAGKMWELFGPTGFLEHYMKSAEPPAGMAYKRDGALTLVRHILATSRDKPGIYIFVTHDFLIGFTAVYLLGTKLEDFPLYLEALFVWEDQEYVYIGYRDLFKQINKNEIFVIDHEAVKQLAYRYMYYLTGMQCPVRVFLAGGVFTSLLTGKQPVDLDFWTPSSYDRDTFIDCLMQRGAVQLPDRPYRKAFKIKGMEVEIKNKVKYRSIQDVVKTFDIGLSAVAAEYDNGKITNTFIHPLAIESIKNRQILLLKPLANPDFFLVSLSRMYKYARRLGYNIPRRELDFIRRFYANLTIDEQKAAIKRLKRLVLDKNLVDRVIAEIK